MLTQIMQRAMAPNVTLSALAPAARKVLATGPGVNRLASFVTAKEVMRRRVRILCADNRFDAFLIGKLAKRQGIDPRVALSSVLISRAFTCHQLVELVNRLEPVPGEVVLITGVCGLFFDEDISNVEAAQMFYRCFWKLKGLARAGLSILMTEGAEAPSERRAYFLRDLHAAADAVLRFSDQTTITFEQRRGLIQT